MISSDPVHPHTCLHCGITFSNYGMFAKRNHEQHCIPCDEQHCIPDNEDCEVDEPCEDIVEEVLDDAVEQLCTPTVCGLDDFEHLTQFLTLGRCHCNKEELQVVKFVHMAHDGYGVSRHFSERMLEYCKSTGGSNVHLRQTHGSGAWR